MLLFLTHAFAGDPCPIGIGLAEYTPSWRDRNTDLAALKSKRTLYGLTYRDRSDKLEYPPSHPDQIQEKLQIGVYIKALVPHTHAAEVLRVGDQVIAIDAVPVSSSKALGPRLTGDKVVFHVKREGRLLQFAVAPTPMDPVLLGLFDLAKTQECRDPAFQALSKEQREAIAAAAFDENKGFRCRDTHQHVNAPFEPGSIIMVRGGSRVLLTMPGWATTCVGVDQTDGDEASKVLTDAMATLTKGYVQDRHDNP